jgi:hypothetical protein
LLSTSHSSRGRRESGCVEWNATRIETAHAGGTAGCRQLRSEEKCLLCRVKDLLLPCQMMDGFNPEEGEIETEAKLKEE